MKKTFITKSSKETQDLAKEILKSKQKGFILALYGNLGSGKTTFSQGIGKHLEIKRRMVSPTFLIMRTYKINNNNNLQNLFHLDLYRIQSEKEINDLGIVELFKNEKNIILIEWPEKIERLLPKETIRIYFSYIDENERSIKIKRNE